MPHSWYLPPPLSLRYSFASGLFGTECIKQGDCSCATLRKPIGDCLMSKKAWRTRLLVWSASPRNARSPRMNREPLNNSPCLWKMLNMRFTERRKNDRVYTTPIIFTDLQSYLGKIKN